MVTVRDLDKRSAHYDPTGRAVIGPDVPAAFIGLPKIEVLPPLRQLRVLHSEFTIDLKEQMRSDGTAGAWIVHIERKEASDPGAGFATYVHVRAADENEARAIVDATLKALKVI